MEMLKKQLVAEALIDLHRRLPTRSHERRMVMQETANLYGVSEEALYRAGIVRRANGPLSHVLFSGVGEIYWPLADCLLPGICNLREL
jgi:hypothetical protein